MVLCFQFTLYTVLFDNSRRHKPCSIVWVNYLRSGMFLTTSLSSVAVLIDVNTDWQWWPLAFYLVSLVAVAAHTGLAVRSLLGSGTSHAQVYFLPAVGGESTSRGSGSADSASFNDAASLRGNRHRLLALRVTVARRRLSASEASNDDEPLQGETTDRTALTRVVGLTLTCVLPPHDEMTPYIIRLSCLLVFSGP